MIEINLQGLNIARVWLEKNNDLLIDDHNTNALFKFNCNSNKLYNDQIIILELFLPRGARIIYGALGLKYKYIPNNELSIKLHSADSSTRVFKNALISCAEIAHVGLLPEYADRILETVTETCSKNSLLPSGEVDFCYAAYSEVSSNAWVFQRLSYILINLLLMPGNSINSETLINLLEHQTCNSTF